jgi:hypothetical protein
VTLVELLADYAGATLETRRDDPCLQGALLIFKSGRRLIIVERTGVQLSKALELSSGPLVWRGSRDRRFQVSKVTPRVARPTTDAVFAPRLMPRPAF